jgi:hypothetical protein
LRIDSSGDTLSIETKKGISIVPHPVIIGGYTTPLIIISAEPTVTPKQRHMLQNWWFASINRNSCRSTHFANSGIAQKPLQRARS